MSEEKNDIRPAENLLNLIEIIPGYRETRSTQHLDKALMEFHQNFKGKGPKKSCEARVKTRTGGEFSYRYAAYADLLNAIKDALYEVGVVMKQPPIRQGNAFGVLTILSHPESGEKVIVGPFLLDNEKGGITGAGAACTSSSRYSITRLLGIALDDDDDDSQSAQGGNYTQGQGYGGHPKQAAGQQSQGKKYEWNHPFPQPGYINAHPNPNQVKTLENMCEKVKKYPANVASQFGANDFASMDFKQYRNAYAAIGDEMIQKGWIIVNGRWRKGQPATGSPMNQFGDPDQQPVFDEEIPF
ncbi:ERF family protein [Acidaminococcus sp.]|uniref:ERF family protein n=1 Tax=Acidaminococcus sp. TaxID=1872103 RepID=UPI003D7D3A10